VKAYRSTAIAALGLALSGCLISGDDKDKDDGPKIPSAGGRECTADPSMGSPVLRRLTAVELESTLQDIFPEIADKWQSGRGDPRDGGGARRHRDRSRQAVLALAVRPEHAR
jgi:hypothetical protein